MFACCSCACVCVCLKTLRRETCGKLKRRTWGCRRFRNQHGEREELKVQQRLRLCPLNPENALVQETRSRSSHVRKVALASKTRVRPTPADNPLRLYQKPERAILRSTTRPRSANCIRKYLNSATAIPFGGINPLLHLIHNASHSPIAAAATLR